MPVKENINGIELKAPSKWDRDTLADGTWLRDNTIIPLYENEKILASAIANSASKIYLKDGSETSVKDLEFRLSGSSYRVDFTDDESDSHMVIPNFNQSSHGNDNDLWFGWNRTSGFNFYDAERITSGISEVEYVSTDVTLARLVELYNAGKRIILRVSSTDYALLYAAGDLSRFTFGIPEFGSDSGIRWMPNVNYYRFEGYTVDSNGCRRISASDLIGSDHIVPTIGTVISYTSAYRADVSGTRYIKLTRDQDQADGHFTYSPALITSAFRSWHNGGVDVGNIKIEERNGYLEFSAGAPSSGGGHDDVWEYVSGEWNAKKLGIQDLNAGCSGSFVCLRDQDSNLPTDVDSYELVIPKRIRNTSDDVIFGKEKGIQNNTYKWFDVSAVSRVSIGTPAYDDDILTII